MATLSPRDAEDTRKKDDIQNSEDTRKLVIKLRYSLRLT